ncbi:MAG TPA: dTMP kinase [Firmicutes bacterium]|uniref:Thymidylate kinase n=1 Tax=Candidatus Coatesbacteria bacterium 4484_99 TaxID=1970774 RepID=A0A1W9S0C0_9BACT|nr:MAG: dTMP kinase [Candidatus Coatesbacteria bacterium 4484_99]RLC41330.1 MAG: dTMP kinase [Candidatus Coatesbacteria bacterium]RLC42035.1 MAG: dTMP kinase [Candidatus Coatesbacteria bacterium]RLC43455.1 MAG: dTMP kinase [Candidatus Coatesbacteria bacterium]HDM43309.1 dTMP kinase [Bacillota bacterium]
MPEGVLITFEGIEGAGKTTQIELLVNWLIEHNITHRYFREPGSTALGEKVRELLLNDNHIDIDPVSELFLYLSARSALVHKELKPALADGYLVILDRFTDSTIAYQGYGLGIDIEMVKQACSLASSGLKPDITFLLDISPEDGLSRLSEFDKIESRGLEFLKRVRSGFLRLAEEDKDRIIVIDATQSIETISHIIIDRLSEFKV